MKYVTAIAAASCLLLAGSPVHATGGEIDLNGFGGARTDVVDMDGASLCGNGGDDNFVCGDTSHLRFTVDENPVENIRLPDGVLDIYGAKIEAAFVGADGSVSFSFEYDGFIQLSGQTSGNNEPVITSWITDDGVPSRGHGSLARSNFRVTTPGGVSDEQASFNLLQSEITLNTQAMPYSGQIESPLSSLVFEGSEMRFSFETTQPAPEGSGPSPANTQIGNFFAIISSVTTVGGTFPPVGGGSTPIPEPATWAMMLAGFGLAAMRLGRRRNVQAAG